MSHCVKPGRGLTFLLIIQLLEHIGITASENGDDGESFPVEASPLSVDHFLLVLVDWSKWRWIKIKKIFIMVGIGVIDEHPRSI